MAVRESADEISLKRTRATLLAPARLVANGLIMPFLLITYYVRPFQVESCITLILANEEEEWPQCGKN